MEHKPKQDEHDSLHENDLAYFLFHFREWWNKHGMTVLVSVLVVLAVVFIIRFLAQREREGHELAWSDLALTTSPEGYDELAARYDDPVVQAIAYRRGADLLVGETMAGSADENQEERAQTLARAAERYGRIVAMADVHEVYRLNAKLGLANVAEAQHDWAKADALYDEVIEQAKAYPSIQRQARARQQMLERLQHPVIFSTAPPEGPPEVAPEVAPEFSPELAPEVLPQTPQSPDASQGPAFPVAPDEQDAGDAGDAAGETLPDDAGEPAAPPAGESAAPASPPDAQADEAPAPGGE